MAHTAPPAAGKAGAVVRALKPLAVALGVAALAWGGLQAWRARPAVAVAPQVAKAAAAAPEPVEESAFRVLRARLREPASAAFREVRVYSFGPPHERAVCGRVSAGRETPAGGADFVVRVILPGSGRTGGAPLPVIEDGPNLPRATANARERYCRNAGDPRPAPQPPQGAAAAAGGNDRGGATQGGGAPAAPRRVAVGGGSAANLRSGPGGGAAIIGVLPRGQVLDVFERAPGGWLRVGVGEPWGWAHASLLIEGP